MDPCVSRTEVPGPVIEDVSPSTFLPLPPFLPPIPLTWVSPLLSSLPRWWRVREPERRAGCCSPDSVTLSDDRSSPPSWDPWFRTCGRALSVTHPVETGPTAAGLLRPNSVGRCQVGGCGPPVSKPTRVLRGFPVDPPSSSVETVEGRRPV